MQARRQGDDRGEHQVDDDGGGEHRDVYAGHWTLSSPPAGLSLGTAEATGKITDNDPINVTVEGPDLVVADSTGNNFRFRLSGDTTASTAITVAYSDDQWHVGED